MFLMLFPLFRRLGYLVRCNSKINLNILFQTYSTYTTTKVLRLVSCSNSCIRKSFLSLGSFLCFVHTLRIIVGVLLYLSLIIVYYLTLTVLTNKRRCPAPDFENRRFACSVFICFAHCAHIHEPDSLFILLQFA
jgi:hypothetical protein